MSAAPGPRPQVEQMPPPTVPLVADAEHWVSWSAPVWRVHQNMAGRPAWNELRHYGPVPTMRFDPQEEPTRPHQPEGVQYVGATALVAFAETFQNTRQIRAEDPSLLLVSWTPVRPLRLLDVRRDFGVANGATASFNAWPDKARVREWARAAHLQWPGMDGILHPAKVTGWDSIALFTAAETDPVWPADPDFARQLTDPAVHSLIQAVATKLRWSIDHGV